jgi:hypothetical protein
LQVALGIGSRKMSKKKQSHKAEAPLSAVISRHRVIKEWGSDRRLGCGAGKLVAVQG